MKKVLVLGAGLVSRPLVRYLLDIPDFSVTVATRTVSKAEELIAGHPRGKALRLLADDRAALAPHVAEHDLSVSLLPAPMHPIVADLCIQHGKHMVTTSYVSPTMRGMDEKARAKGVMLLNELGVDPGIDHMSAMRIIDNVKSRGGKIVSFRSCCGGLPAAEANTNPFGYKFSWSPRGVCTAGKNSAQFRENDKVVEVPGPELFTRRYLDYVDGVGILEVYPNRDSLSYIDVYGLQGVSTLFRGTYRYVGWCETLKSIVDLGLLDETPTTYPAGTTYAQFLAGVIGASASANIREAAAAKVGLKKWASILDRLEWLGLFSNEPIPGAGAPTTRLDVLANRMLQKMQYAPGERDMLVLVHKFLAELPGGRKENISSTMVDYGIPNGDSSMARTVSLPAAIGVKLILTGKILTPGVHVPVSPNIYNPVLDELAKLNIRCVEKTTPA